MATLFSITEGVQKLLEGADPASKKKFAKAEINRYVVQVINGMLKTQHMTEEMAGGETIPEGTVLAEYDNVAVERYKNVSRSTLPVMPIKLPMGMGVFHVSRTDDVINGFIPFEAGQLQMIDEEAYISDILGQVGYEIRGKHIVYNKDYTTGDEFTRMNEVYMLLAVKDLSLYGDWDLLPIPSSMEADVIMATFRLLSGQNTQNKVVDVINKEEAKA